MSGESVITQQMLDAVDVESEPVTHEVEKGAIIRFAQAIGDPSPIYNDERAARSTRYGGLVAPPTFLRSMMSGPEKAKLEIPFTGTLDGGSDWEYFEPVHAGDRITVTTRVADLSEKQGRLGTMLFVVSETKYVNQFGNVVGLQRNTAIRFQPPEE